MYLSLHLVLFYVSGGNIQGSRDCCAAMQFGSAHYDIHELSRIYQSGNVKFEPLDEDLLVFLTTLSQVPEATILLVSPSSAILYSTHKQDHPVLVFFVSTPTRFSHIVKSDRFPLDDRLIVYCIYNTASLSVHLTMGTEGCSHVFFTPVNIAAMYLGVQAFL